MLTTNKILTLLLVIVEIGGTIQHKNLTQVKVGAPKQQNSQRSTLGALVSSRGLKGGRSGRKASSDYDEGSNHTESNAHPGGKNYVAVGADGSAEMAFKIDLSLFIQRLNMIPELRQIVGALVRKVELLASQGGQRIPADADGVQPPPEFGDGVQAQIAAMEKSIMARLHLQETKINSLFQLIQQLQGETGTISQGMNQILAILRNISGSDGGGAGKFCAQEMATVEGLIRQMMTTITQVFETITVMSRPSQGTGNSSRYVLESIQANSALLQQLTTMIKGTSQQVCRGVSCTQLGTGGPAAESQTLKIVNSVVTLIQNLPQQILIALKNSWLLGGSSELVVTYMQKVMQSCISIITEVVTVRDSLLGARQELRRHFAESRKHLVAVKRVVTESTEMVSSAAAAISVGSRMKCPTSTHPDLEDWKM